MAPSRPAGPVDLRSRLCRPPKCRYLHLLAVAWRSDKLGGGALSGGVAAQHLGIGFRRVSMAHSPSDRKGCMRCRKFLRVL